MNYSSLFYWTGILTFMLANENTMPEISTWNSWQRVDCYFCETPFGSIRVIKPLP